MKKLLLIGLILLSSTITFSSTQKDSERKAFDVEGTKYIIRPIFGLATKSDLGELVTFENAKEDPKQGKIAGLQVERYIYKRPLDLPVNLTFQTSFLTHYDNYKKDANSVPLIDKDYYSEKKSYEFNLGIKFYWLRFPWDRYVRTRLGISEGLSYASRVTNLELLNQYKKKNSNLLNYIDVTLSFNAKDISRIEQLENTYIGIGISHRSGIFGTINGVDGGSNNITAFFETEL